MEISLCARSLLGNTLAFFGSGAGKDFVTCTSVPVSHLPRGHIVSDGMQSVDKAMCRIMWRRLKRTNLPTAICLGKD